MSKTHYVNCILMSEDRSEICVIFKQRGPSEVLHKFNFIGGKVEPDENLQQAVIREVKEETGLDLNGETIDLLLSVEEEHYLLDNHVAFIPKWKLRQARTCESEKISILTTENLLHELNELPNKYAPSFKMLFNAALAYNKI